MTQQPNPYEAAYPIADEPKGRKVPWILLTAIFGVVAVAFLGVTLTYTTRAWAMAEQAQLEAERAMQAEQARDEAEKLRTEKDAP